MTNNAIDLLRRLDPVATADPADAVRPESRADLLGGITAQTAAVPMRRKARRRVVPLLAAAATVAVLSFGVLQVPDGNGGQQPLLGPALAFATEGKVIKIRVLDAQAEAARFNQELKAHGLNITMELRPASPSLVGEQMGESISIAHPKPRPGHEPMPDPFNTTLYPADCRERNVPCVPEFTVPLNYPDTTKLTFGRTAEPGRPTRPRVTSAGGVRHSRGCATGAARSRRSRSCSRSAVTPSST